MMKMEWHETLEGSLIFSGEVSKIEMEKIKLDELDHKTVSMPAFSASDMLLKLELLFRAHEKQQAERK